MTAPVKVDNITKAYAAWGDPPPDWIVVLAECCDAETQAAVARRLGYSSTAVSLALSNTYRGGDMVRFESAVRGALMAETVTCPVLGAEIGRDVCQNWQRRPFSTASANAVRMYQGCRSGCPHSRLPKHHGSEGGEA
ncbi:transcriptional regulator [Shinella sp.]|jgi:hypothetical protein|uniref:transcriptional regulator n=1 Tax=Shinella sp. TaxID=1870904 RepID=UPI003F71251D